MIEYNGLEINWDGGGSVRVTDRDFTVAVDPSESSPNFEAGLILITSEDASQLNQRVLKQVCGRGTCVIVPESVEGASIPCQDVEYVEAGEVLDIFGVKIEAMETGSGLSYRFEMRKSSFFATGDSGLKEEVIKFENTVNVAFLQVSGEEVTPENVIRTAVRLKPDLAIPYRFNSDSLEINLENLVADLEDRNIKCKILGES